MKTFRHEKGFTLVSVLLVLMVLSVLGLSMTTLALGTMRMSADERDNQSAYYIAEAGLNNEMYKIKKTVEDIYNQQDRMSDFFTEINQQIITVVNMSDFEETFAKQQPEAIVTIGRAEETGEANRQHYTIHSKGMIGEEERTVLQNFSIIWKDKNVPYELPPLAVYTYGDIVLTNGPIIGSVGTLSTKKHAIIAGSGELKVRDGEVFVPPIDADLAEDNKLCQTIPVEGYKAYSVKRPTNENNMPCPKITDMWAIPSLPTFLEAPENLFEPEELFIADKQIVDNNRLLITKEKLNHQTLFINDTLKLKEIKINANRHFTIDVGAGHKHLIVDHLNLENGQFKLAGEGTLTLHITNKITFGSGSTLNESDKINQMNIFYEGIKSLNLSGSQKIFGSIYAKNASVHLSGGASIAGNIFSGGKQLTITGGAGVETQLVLAPEAHVEVTGGGDIYGMIMAKKFTHDSGAKVIHGEPFVTKGPISPAVLKSENESPPGETDRQSLISFSPIRELKDES